MGHVKRLWLLATLSLLMSGIAFAGTCGNGYTNRYKLVVPHKIFNSALSNQVWSYAFNGASTYSQPLDALKTVANGGAVNNTAANSKGFTGPADAIVCDAASAGNAVKFEIEGGYSASTGAAIIDIFHSSLSNTTDNERWLFIGNSGVSTSQQDLSLWSDAGFFLVCHHNDGTTLSVVCSLNSGSETNHGSTAAAIGLRMNGGGSSYASGSSQYSNTGKVQNLTDYTISGSVNSPGGSFNVAVSNADSGEANGVLFLYESTFNQYECAYRNGGSFTRRRGGSMSSTVSRFACVHTAGSANLLLYVDGVSTGSLTDTGATNPGNTGVDFVFGRDGAASAGYWNAKFDEFRASASARSADELAAESYNLTSPAGTFVVIDAPIKPAGMTTAGKYCIPISIGAGMVGGTDATNFQYLYRVTADWMAYSTGYGAESHGYDLTWFSDSTCSTPLTFDRPHWDATAADGAFRILVPSISHTTGAMIYLGIGDSSITTDQQNKAGTWTGINDSWDFGSPTSLTTTDNGAGNMDVSQGSTGSGAFACISPIGGAVCLPNDQASSLGYDPSGSDTLSAHGVPVGSSPSTIIAWVRSTPETVAEAALNGFDSNFMGYGKTNSTPPSARNLQLFSNGTTEAIGVTTGQLNTPDVAIYSGLGTSTPAYDPRYDWRWRLVAWSYPNGAQINASSLYLDGSLVSSPQFNSGTTVLNTSNNSGASGSVSELRIGRYSSHGIGWFTGGVAGLRIIAGTVTDDYVLAVSNNESQNWKYRTFGTAVPITPPAGGTEQLIRGIITLLNEPSMIIEGIAKRQVAGTYIKSSISGVTKYGTNENFSTLPNLFHMTAIGSRNRAASWTWKWNAQRLPTIMADPKMSPISPVFLQSNILNTIRKNESVTPAMYPKLFPNSDRSPWSERNFIGVSVASAPRVWESQWIGQPSPNTTADPR